MIADALHTLFSVVDGSLFSDNATHYEDPYQTKVCTVCSADTTCRTRSQ